MIGNNNTPPHWSEAPDWAQWRCQDSDGEWIWYEFAPISAAEVWRLGVVGRFQNAGLGEPNPDWRLTLEKRPE